MKISAIYETADIVRLIRQDLVQQGLNAGHASIDFDGQATVTIDVPPDAEPEPAAPLVSASAPAAKPALEAIEGGAASADMSEIIARSAGVAAAKKGIFPTAPQHKMLDGESTDWPGEKR